MNFGSKRLKTQIRVHKDNINCEVLREIVFGPSFTPYPLFQWYPQSKDILENLRMKCWNSAFNAQGSRLIIVVVQLGAVKLYVAALETLSEIICSSIGDAQEKKERQVESHPVYDQTQGSGAVFFLLYR
jgi:predicted oxidoreductase (fatty acid repression mutant protein)